jgi:3-oxoacyl-[acyl-carrier-protein] synthase III
MVIGTDTFSRVLPEDPMLQLSTGDGAAAVVLGPGGTEARLSAAFTTEPAPGLVGVIGPLPPSVDSANPHRLSGDVLGFGDAALSLYGRVGTAAVLATDDVPTWLLPQQSNRPLIEALAAQFEIDRVWERVGRHGNIGAGNVLAAWSEARREGFFRPGTAGLCAVVGGGVTAGAMMWRC